MQETSLRRSTKALLLHADGTRVGGRVLDLGSAGGEVAKQAMAAGAAAAEYCHIDLRACEAVADDRVACHHDDRLPAGPFDLVFLDSAAFEPAYARELAERTAGVLAPGGALYATPPEQLRAERWAEFLAERYAEVTDLGGEVLLARHPAARTDVEEVYHWSAEFAGRALQFEAGPGVFAPRGLDAGTQAMLEAVPAPSGSISVLDLGCGAGTVAVVAAACWGCTVTATDVNARALRLTKANAAANGVADRVEVLASDGFSALQGRRFDLILNHPPYHADYAVVKGLIEGAHRHLALGGSLWLVVKQADWYQRKLREVFGGCRVLEQAGYFVLQAERREQVAKPTAAQKPATTAKHQKRLEQASARKRGRK